MKITKKQLKEIIKEEIKAVASEGVGVELYPSDNLNVEEEPQTLETLMADLQELLEKWPACEDEPGGMACRYHKDLEEIILNYGGIGCGPDAHGDLYTRKQDNHQANY